MRDRFLVPPRWFATGTITPSALAPAARDARLTLTPSLSCGSGLQRVAEAQIVSPRHPGGPLLPPTTTCACAMTTREAVAVKSSVYRVDNCMGSDWRVWTHLMRSGPYCHAPARVALATLLSRLRNEDASSCIVATIVPTASAAAHPSPASHVRLAKGRQFTVRLYNRSTAYAAVLGLEPGRRLSMFSLETNLEKTASSRAPPGALMRFSGNSLASPVARPTKSHRHRSVSSTSMPVESIRPQPATRGAAPPSPHPWRRDNPFAPPPHRASKPANRPQPCVAAAPRPQPVGTTKGVGVVR